MVEGQVLSEEAQVDYPCIKKLKCNDVYVLFGSKTGGTVLIGNSAYPVGHRCLRLNPDFFELTDKKISLQNKKL